MLRFTAFFSLTSDIFVEVLDENVSAYLKSYLQKSYFAKRPVKSTLTKRCSNFY
jgi:hypothetical protein